MVEVEGIPEIRGDQEVLNARDNFLDIHLGKVRNAIPIHTDKMKQFMHWQKKQVCFGKGETVPRQDQTRSQRVGQVPRTRDPMPSMPICQKINGRWPPVVTC
jgi:hypothetical protein